jgi:hypothetical protein
MRRILASAAVIGALAGPGVTAGLAATASTAATSLAMPLPPGGVYYHC